MLHLSDYSTGPAMRRRTVVRNRYNISVKRLIRTVAMTDSTFSKVGNRWVGKCLICNGNLSVDEHTGVGANVEHIVPRSRGGTNDLLNLALTHPACNSEKGRNWDSPRKRRDRAGEYDQLISRLLARRRERWSRPGDADLPGTNGAK